MSAEMSTWASASILPLAVTAATSERCPTASIRTSVVLRSDRAAVSEKMAKPAPTRATNAMVNLVRFDMVGVPAYWRSERPTANSSAAMALWYS